MFNFSTNGQIKKIGGVSKLIDSPEIVYLNTFINVGLFIVMSKACEQFNYIIYSY